MFDDLFEFGKCFDWITPLVSTLQDIANGPSHTFLISAYSGYSGNEIKKILNDHGVKNWGAMIPPYSDTLMITVCKAQAKFGDYLLQRAGVPILNPIATTNNQIVEPAEEEDNQLGWGWG